MKVLALTHAHLNVNGLSPVSCERADSVTGTWADRLDWEVDVIHTAGTKWPGIWPNGKGMKVNIITADAPPKLMMGNQQLFAATLKSLIANTQPGKALSLVNERITKRFRAALSKNDLALPHELAIAKKWGIYLSAHIPTSKPYDFIFACVGYGDEYLLETALVLSKKMNVPMVVDFRDFWSDHHEPHRFTPKQRKQIRQYEKRLLATTKMVSVPQKHMVNLMKKWSTIPVHLLSHSAYVAADWSDGKVISDEFTMLYAGKLYPNGPGIIMLMELLQQLSKNHTPKPFRCHFYVDDTTKLTELAAAYGVSHLITVNGWVSPSQLWVQLRSAHLLLITDSGVDEHFPMLPTKTFQYAYSGRQILCLHKYENTEMQEFLDQYNAGTVCTDAGTASAWVNALMKQEELYSQLPPLRKILLREDMAAEYGAAIMKILN